MADVGEKAVKQLCEAVAELLGRTQPPEKAASLAELLAAGTWTHDYPITYGKAQQFGLRVRPDMPAEILELMGLFPQPTYRQPSVEYLPERRRAERPGLSGERPWA